MSQTASRCGAQAKFRQEIELLKACTHDNVVGFRAACLDAPGHLMLVMEVCWPDSTSWSCTHMRLVMRGNCVIPARSDACRSLIFGLRLA
jgi:hypothetical protein